MARIPLMAGNWKMNLDHLQANQLVQKLAWTLGDLGHDYSKVNVAVIPPFTDIRSVQTVVEADQLSIRYGAQDVSTHDDGAYTGEISTNMLVKLGCTYAVVGHSERREYHGETNELIGAKAKKALEAGLTPIVCCGEALDVRKEGRQVEYVIGQIDAMFADLTGEQVAASVVAYEPIWAIGTGEVATPDDAQEVCGAIRGRIAELYDGAIANAVRIQYGGSVKSSNVVDIMAQPDVDGALVGGASLKAEEFAKIVPYYEKSPHEVGAASCGAHSLRYAWSAPGREEPGGARPSAGRTPQSNERRRLHERRGKEHTVHILLIICEVLLVITSILLVLSILLHKGKGGGISDMFGGGISTSMRSSGVAERNLNYITVVVAIIWAIVIVLIGLIVRFS